MSTNNTNANASLLDVVNAGLLIGLAGLNNLNLQQLTQPEKMALPAPNGPMQPQEAFQMNARPRFCGPGGGPIEHHRFASPGHGNSIGLTHHQNFMGKSANGSSPANMVHPNSSKEINSALSERILSRLGPEIDATPRVSVLLGYYKDFEYTNY